ncbi:MAG: hypothetical protein RI973_1124 [Bacteroidota bacterium]|jgi:hypothetical protein
MTNIISFHFALALICLLSCEKAGGEVESVAWEKHLLDCRMERLKAQNDSLWSEMTAWLDQNLPKDIPAAERKNMVSTQNAYLLKLFRVYPSLDTAIKARIRNMEEKDWQLVAEMRKIMERYRIVEHNLNQALEQAGEGELRGLKEKLDRIEAQACQR